MIHKNNKVKQVEINTIAASFGGIGTHMPELNRYGFTIVALIRLVVIFGSQNAL